MELLCRSEDLGGALSTTPGAGVLGGAHPAKPEPAFPEGPLPASGARWPQASGRPSPGSSSASGRYWPAGSPQVRGCDLEGKVEFCQSTVGRKSWRVQFPPTLPDPVVPRPRSRPGRIVSFLLAAWLFAGRNFPGLLIEGETSPPLEWAAGEARGACGEVMGKLGKSKMGVLKMGKLKRRKIFIFIFFKRRM